MNEEYAKKLIQENEAIEKRIAELEAENKKLAEQLEELEKKNKENAAPKLDNSGNIV